MTNNSQLPNSDVPKGVNLKYTNFGKSSNGPNDGYNSQKLNETSFGNSKTRSNITKAGRPGAGWEDDEDDSNVNKPNSFSNNNKAISSSKASTQNTENTLYSVESLSEQNIEYEIKVISEVIQPQGARVKPSDSMLIPFGKACESLKTEIVGSILISNIVTEVPWLILMKTLYAIEYLIKNFPKYFKYFQFHKKILSQIIFPSEENQASQVSNLTNGIIAVLEYKTASEKTTYQDELLLKNLANIQSQSQETKSGGDLLDLEVKSSENVQNKKKLNAFDMFSNTKVQVTVPQKPSFQKDIQPNILQTQTIDVLDGGNLEVAGQKNEQKRKFKFANKPKPSETEPLENSVSQEQSKEISTIKQNRFDPFSLNNNKVQESAPVENKKKKFEFLKKSPETNEGNLMNMNLNLDSPGTDNQNNNILGVQQGLTSLNLNINNQGVSLPLNNSMKPSNSTPNLNQKPDLNSLYNLSSGSPMIGNLYNNNHQQMNTGIGNLRNVNMGQMNQMSMGQMNQVNMGQGMGQMNMGPINMGAMNMGPMNMGPMNLGQMGQMNSLGMNMMNMNPMNMNLMGMNSMNMGGMNPMMNMGSMNMMGSMGMGGYNNSMGPQQMGTLGMNYSLNGTNNNYGKNEVNKIEEKEKKEPKKVIDESAFDFIKF